MAKWYPKKVRLQAIPEFITETEMPVPQLGSESVQLLALKKPYSV